MCVLDLMRSGLPWQAEYNYNTVREVTMCEVWYEQWSYLTCHNIISKLSIFQLPSLRLEARVT